MELRCAIAASGAGRQRLDFRKLRFDLKCRSLEFVSLLKIHSELRGCVEVSPKPQSGVGRDAHLLLHDPFDPRARQPKVFCQGSRAHAERHEIFFAKILSGMDRAPELKHICSPDGFLGCKFYSSRRMECRSSISLITSAFQTLPT